MKNNFTSSARVRRLLFYLLLPVCMSVNTSAQVLINETFTTGSGTTAPTGWGNIDNVSSGEIWDFSNPAGRAIQTAGGAFTAFDSQFGILDSDDYGSSGNQDADLETPTFDASLPGTYQLEFDDNWEPYTGSTATVEVYDGSSWTAVLTLTSTTDGDGTENPSTHRSIDITSYTGSNSAAKVRFNYTGSYGYWWAIDNVKISRLSCTPPTVTMTIVPNCAVGQFSVDVDVTALGSATSVTVTDGVNTYGTPLTAPGIISAGPFAAGSQGITVIHNLDVACNVSNNVTYFCGDECSNAAILAVNAGQTCTAPLSTSNIDATNSTDPAPTCAGGPMEHDVWFTFTPSGINSQLNITNVTSGDLYNDLGVTVYSGSCGSFTELYCEEYNSGQFFGLTYDTPIDLIGLSTSNTYYVRVWSSDYYASPEVDFDVCVTTLPNCYPPPSGLADANTTQNTTDISWTGNTGGSFTLEYGPTGFTPGTGATAGTNGTIISPAVSPQTISGLAPGTTYDVYVREDCSASSNGYSDNSDAYTLTTVPTCSAPTALTASAFTTTTADLGWTDNVAAQWEVNYNIGTTFTAGTGTNSFVTSSNPYNATGLLAGTAYSYFVRAICGPNDTSAWSSRYSFATLCNAITAFPWTETFETNSSTLLCWASIDGNNDGSEWGRYTGYPNNGTYAAGLYTDGNGGDNSDWMISAPITLTGNQRLTYYYRVRSASEPNDYTIKLSTATSDTLDFTNILKPLTTVSNTTYQQDIIDLSGYTGTVYLAFHVPAGGLDGWYLYVDDITVEDIPSCFAPTTPVATAITPNNADLGWTEPASATAWEVSYATGNTFLPGGGTQVYTTINPLPVAQLNSGLQYSFFVRSICGPGDTSTWSNRQTFSTTLTNDLPATATSVMLNAGCSGATFHNVGATFATGEPSVSCRGTSVTVGSLVWFKFVAPSNGFVKVSTDAPGTMDTKLGVFATSNPADPTDLASFSIIGCDDDNGVTVGAASIVYTSGLTPGATYYIAVDHFDGTSTGNFCVSVDSVAASMISPAGSCLATGNTTSLRADYLGWVTMVDDQGRLIANARRTTAGNTNTFNYTPSLTVNTGAIRQSGSDYYLDRNFGITYNSSVSTTHDLKLYFLNTELAALAAVNPNATLASLVVNHQSGSCEADFDPANGTNSSLGQTSNGSTTDISWIQVNTPGFSNFYISSGTPLRIQLGDITATNVGKANRVNWSTLSEAKSDKFELQRSANGKDFVTIMTKQAKGEANRYTYVDEQAIQGINYYRLKMIEGSGKAVYSKIVSAIVTGKDFSVSAYPNPVSDNITIMVSGVQGSNATIQVTDITGKILKTIEMDDNQETINMNSLANGIYLIKYSDANHTQTIRVNKQ